MLLTCKLIAQPDDLSDIDIWISIPRWLEKYSTAMCSSLVWERLRRDRQQCRHKKTGDLAFYWWLQPDQPSCLHTEYALKRFDVNVLKIVDDGWIWRLLTRRTPKAKMSVRLVTVIETPACWTDVIMTWLSSLRLRWQLNFLSLFVHCHWHDIMIKVIFFI